MTSKLMYGENAIIIEFDKVHLSTFSSDPDITPGLKKIK